MSTLYEISEDLRAVQDLLDACVDEDGNPREPTEEEKAFIKECFMCSSMDFENKFDSYCKFIKNYKLRAENADNERKTYKEELDRLSKRSKAFANRAKSLQEFLQFNMENLNTPKFKSDLFTATIQKSPVSVSAIGSVDTLPECYLKPRELDTMAVKKAIKEGKLETKEGGDIVDVKTGKILPGIVWSQNQTLVIR